MAARTPRAPRLRANLTADLIREGVRRDSGYCMFAEAVKAAYPDATRVAVDLQTVRLTNPKKGLRYTYLTPRICQVALVNFDQGTEPEPFPFQLRNGQVTRAAQKIKSDKKLSPAEVKQRQAAASKARGNLKKARLVDRKDSPGAVPDRVGGKTPPVVPISRRRAFGLRALER